MMTEFSNTGECVEEVQLAEFESKWGFRLPDDYKRFLLTVNGGRPNPHVLDFNGDDLLGVHTFESIGGDGINNLEVCKERSAGRIPARMLPIGNDECGNKILISVSGADCGKVYFWDHELEADPAQGEDPETVGNLTLVADSFPALIDGLRELRPDER